MDTEKIDKDGYSPLKDEFDRIENISNIEDVQKEITHQHNMGIYPMFALFGSADDKNSDMVIAHLVQSGLGLSDRDYYLSQDPRSEDIRDEYVKHIKNMFVLLGDSLLMKRVTMQTFAEITKPLKEAAKKVGMKEEDVSGMVHRFRSKKISRK